MGDAGFGGLEGDCGEDSAYADCGRGARSRFLV